MQRGFEDAELLQVRHHDAVVPRGAPQDLVDLVEAAEQKVVLRVVRGKNHRHHRLAEGDAAVIREVAQQVAAGLVADQFERERGVHHLEWASVVVADRQWMPGLHQKRIGHPGMSRVVSERSEQRREAEMLARVLVQATSRKEMAHRLTHIRSMDGVVIRIVQVLGLKRDEKFLRLGNRNLQHLEGAVPLENRHAYHHQRPALRKPGDAEDVKARPFIQQQELSYKAGGEVGLRTTKKSCERVLCAPRKSTLAPPVAHVPTVRAVAAARATLPLSLCPPHGLQHRNFDRLDELQVRRNWHVGP
mmetsp:Transcript_6347/g.17661  ORF Transcript_6347/g.17661 Transcript_6347/m.17661 type:complete len:303 (-) Transcript_6347:172-1080(-)